MITVTNNDTAQINASLLSVKRDNEISIGSINKSSTEASNNLSLLESTYDSFENTVNTNVTKQYDEYIQPMIDSLNYTGPSNTGKYVNGVFQSGGRITSVNYENYEVYSKAYDFGLIHAYYISRAPVPFTRFKLERAIPRGSLFYINLYLTSSPSYGYPWTVDGIYLEYTDSNNNDLVDFFKSSSASVHGYDSNAVGTICMPFVDYAYKEYKNLILVPSCDTPGYDTYFDCKATVHFRKNI